MQDLDERLIAGLQQAISEPKGSEKIMTIHVKIKEPMTWSSEMVRELRKERGVSQALLARLLGVSRRTVESWEANNDRIVEGPASRLLSLYAVDPKLWETHGVATI